jgi:hypothetical protein
MEVQLESVSPISFLIARIGELVRIQHKPAKVNEYREKIGPAVECYLVVKGQTKIGMIPSEVVRNHKELLRRKNCRISRIDQANSLIMVVIGETHMQRAQ